MNQEEEMPARVTRGALRRRSVDQEATPQKLSGVSVSGTPNKTNSTTKRMNALNPIQESEGRPSTPIVQGRTSRRRVSETIDTPTSLPNKLVLNLKEMGSESGKRSRNTSLTEENLNALNVAYEGNSAVQSGRTRTPARVRASHETLLTSGSPLTVTPAVRRSTRRNSVTSEDGNISVQSLPVTTPKITSGVRKDDTIIEEDASDDRAESVSSETSARHTRSQSVLSQMSASASPRYTAASPVLVLEKSRNESTPPRTSTTPRVALTPLSLTKMSPRSKNVSFSDDSKRDDNHSAYPKTPTSVSKEVFIIVEDLRKHELKGVSPKVDAVVELSPKTKSNEVQALKAESVKRDDQALNETDQITTEDKFLVVETNDDSAVGKVSDNDVSGIDVLDPPGKEVVSTTQAEANDTLNENVPAADQYLLEGNKFPQTWSQPVRRSATKGIDEYSVRKQEEQERLEEANESLQKAPEVSSFKESSPVSKEQQSAKGEEKEEDEEEEVHGHEFEDNEALEVEDYQSCDSMNSELKREIEENEIPDHGEELGSQDSEDTQEDDDEDASNDSWIVSDGDELEDEQQQIDEEQLLRSSNDDLPKDSVASSRPKRSKAPTRRRIIEVPDESDDEEGNTSGSVLVVKSSPSTSPKVATKSTRRSATSVSVQQNSDIQTNETNLVGSLEKSATTTGTPSKDVGSTIKSPGKVSSNQKELSKPVEPSYEKEENTTECSTVMFEDVNEVTGQGDQSEKEQENNVSLSKSPKKADSSRKSLPAAKLADPTVFAAVRKSLPASTKMLISETASVKEDDKIPPLDNAGSEQEVVDVDENEEVEIISQDNETIDESASSSSQVALEKSAAEATTTDRKSMPPVSLISAQFYIAGTKKRHTVGGGGGDSTMLTSTPKPNESSAVMSKKNKSAVEKVDSRDSKSIVPNPFALAKSAKLKSRVSLDSGTAIKQGGKKSRLSLPTKFAEEDLPPEAETGVSNKNDPEPMEVDIEQEDDGNENAATQKEDDDAQTDDDVSVHEIQAAEKNCPPKPVKPKPKALEDYNLANILVRCNEVMREEKERKKQLASVLRKKKEEKKRLRELEKQEEEEAARSAANTSSTDNDPNSTNASTGEEPTKKKKKRKPKVKNYLLEELAETRKERVEHALRHKLEVIERRKQRKKDRQLEKHKQLDKENGDGVSVTGGIAAKLEKMKKKQKAKASDDDAKAAKESKSNDPPVRVALSAFAVLHQPQLSASIAAVNGKQTEPSDEAQKVVVSPVEKKQLLETSNKNGSSHQQLHVKEILKKTTKGSPAKETTEEAAGKKKLGTMPVSEASSNNTQQNVVADTKEIAVDRVVKATNGKVTADPEPYAKGEKPKEKKKKKKQMDGLNEADSVVPKQKKSKQIKLNHAAQDPDKSIQGNATSAIEPFCSEVEKVGKPKSNKKKLTTKTENGTIDDGNMIALSRKKPMSETIEPTIPVQSIVPAKKRKREQQSDSSIASTSRPAKHTKLQVLQRIESGGFFVENVTPDKVRLKRNFGFQERQATPAKQLGFKVSSLLPTGQEELRGMATSSKKYLKDGQKKSKYGEQSMSLPLPVWTSSGVFFESAAEENKSVSDNRKVLKEKSGDYIQLKVQGKGEFKLKALRPGLSAGKPHRVDRTTIDQSVLNFKRQQLLEKTAHLREKKSQRV